jgi:prophage maintenance system killer protein
LSGSQSDCRVCRASRLPRDGRRSNHLRASNARASSEVNLADSALHAPAAGFGETDLYPDFVDKAAVLVVRLAKNHPLPDGNKRCAWVALRLFVEINN